MSTPLAKPSMPSITPEEKVPRNTIKKRGIIRIPKDHSPKKGICISVIPNLLKNQYPEIIPTKETMSTTNLFGKPFLKLPSLTKILHISSTSPIKDPAIKAKKGRRLCPRLKKFNLDVIGLGKN